MGERPLLLALAVSLALTACGPSLRGSHRASAYFEQCYAADLDRTVSDAERRACWQAWSRGYLIGASPERLDYVHERLAMLDPDRAAAIALATGDDGSIETLDTPEPDGTAPTTEGTEGDATPPVTPAFDPTPAPREPTPSEASPPDESEARQRADARHARTRERHLHRGIVAPSSLTPRCPCEAQWQQCSSACVADARGCIGACRREFTLCSRSCY